MDIKKLIAKLPSGFVEDVAGMSSEAMEDAIVASEANIRRVEAEREGDEKLRGARELVKNLSGPYADAVKAQRAKIAYLLWQLEERGELIDESPED